LLPVLFLSCRVPVVDFVHLLLCHPVSCVNDDSVGRFGCGLSFLEFFNVVLIRQLFEHLLDLLRHFRLVGDLFLFGEFNPSISLKSIFVLLFGIPDIRDGRKEIGVLDMKLEAP